VTQRPATLTSVRLKYRGADVFLSEGQYVLGRSASCQIVLDDARVSRRHATITVSGGQVVIDDLGSVNGVYVNGLRIQGQRALLDGDRIGIGGAELELKLGAVSSERRERNTLQTSLAAVREELQRARHASDSPESEPPLSPLQPFDSEPPTSAAGTVKADVFELVGPIAQRALSSARPAEAERILDAHLGKVVADYRKGRTVSQPARDSAVNYGLELATALGSSKWLSYVLDVLVLGRVLLDSRLTTRLISAITRVDRVDSARVSAYVTMLREMPQSFEKVRALHQADEVLKAAGRGS
jgi:pSer/pThr/pTyr-binding forkhead associated (FHA) protein